MAGIEFFLSGIDTDCGKTYCTGLLANALQIKHTIITAKLIQTGCEGVSEDILAHRKMMGVELLQEDLSYQTCPFVLSFPASPHLASKIDSKEINFSIFRNSIENLKEKYEIVITEGAGGLMVPITHDYLTINYIQDHQLPLILVGSSKLGSLNHTLLSLHACKTFGLNLHAFIYNEFPNHNPLIAEDSYQFLCNFLKREFPQTQVLKSDELSNFKLTL